MIKWNNLNTLSSFENLSKVERVKLAEVMSGENGADRVKKYTIPMAAGLSYNYAAKQVDDDVLEALTKLAEEAQLAEKFEALYNGEVINTGEKRLVLHHMTRGQLGEAVEADGVDKRTFYTEQQKKIADFANKVHAGEITNAAGEKFTTVVQIGIGGSDLGPRAMYLALENWAKKNNTFKMEAKFISNVDPDDAAAVLNSIDVALVFAFLAGMVAGFVTGILHTAFGIPGILASILTQIGLYSINLGIMGKSNQAINVLQYKLVASLRYVTGEGSAFFFLKLILGAVALIAIIYWFFGTELGASIRATGCNPQMASAQGINTSFNKVLALMISNGLVGLCGGIYAQYQGAADVNMGRGAIVIGLAAVIISEVIFGKLCAGKKIAFALTLAAIFFGAIIYYIVIAFVLWLKMPSDYMKLFSAVVVACFLAVPYMKEKYFKKRRTA